MNVLITGGCGFIGSFVAERFYKEGYNIYIIDNLITGQRSNVTVPHKFYQLSVEDKKCEEIFRSISPDIVVHLAAQVDVVTSLKRPQLDTQSNILGLVNMLHLAHKADVSKFIFASSAAIYGPYDQVSLSEKHEGNPVSPYGINKKLGEYYCEKWNELYGLKTLCLRFSNVYGPRQGSLGEGGVVSIFMDRLRDGKDINVYGDGGQTRDFIYVEDVVDGIYRGTKSDVTGVYNLSTNNQTSINQLIEVLGSLKQVSKVNYLQPREGDIYKSSLDNTRIKQDLDWVPIYSLEEGLSKTHDWFKQSQQASQPKLLEDKKMNMTGLISTIKPYVENLLAFAVIASITLFGTEILMYTSIDIKLIYIILLGIIYGTRQSALSAVLASGLFIFESISKGREWISLFYDPEVLFMIAIYLFFGLIVGFVSDKSRRDHVRHNSELEMVNEKYAFLKEVYTDTRAVKDELQHQLINSKDSIGRIYGIIKTLESLEPEEVVTSSVNVLSNLLDVERISIYSVNDSDFLRLMISSNVSGFNLPKTMRVSDHTYIQEVLSKERLFVNRSMNPDEPMLVAPILHEEKVVAVVSVYDPSFSKLNLSFENVFKVSVELISGSLSRAFKHAVITRNERFVEDTSVLKSSVFLQVLESKSSAKQQYNSDFVLLQVIHDGLPIKILSEQITTVLRDSDYLGMMENNLVLLLSNSNIKEADIVVQRLIENGIVTRVISEVEIYA
ncbi:NAD-dependent epimerase/dehydratase family protein [Paenibacillus sp. CMAA1364]